MLKLSACFVKTNLEIYVKVHSWGQNTGEQHHTKVIHDHNPTHTKVRMTRKIVYFNLPILDSTETKKQQGINTKTNQELNTEHMNTVG